jgi:hypothetical protein
MAKVEFYKIIVRNKKEGDVLKNSIAEIIKKKLDTSSAKDKYCMKSTCSAILAEYKDNTDSLTFDFSKFTDKIINSTIISQPLSDTNTFHELNKKIIESTTYTQDEKSKIFNLISMHIGNDLIDRLIDSEIDNFTIYKILIDTDTSIEQKEIDTFYRKALIRMEKEKIFFNITSFHDDYILLFQKASHGFDVNHLSDYLNTHLLVNENFKVYFDKIYDSPFIEILENADLTNFTFAYSTKEKSILDKDYFSIPFLAIAQSLGNSTITVSAKAEKNNPLNNKILLDFFELASNAGLLESCSVKAKGNQSFVHSSDKGLQLNYTKSVNIDTIEEANDFFIEAFSEKEHVLLLKR